MPLTYFILSTPVVIFSDKNVATRLLFFVLVIFWFHLLKLCDRCSVLTERVAVCECSQIVCCDYRRVPTSTYCKAFPSADVVGKITPL